MVAVPTRLAAAAAAKTTAAKIVAGSAVASAMG